MPLLERAHGARSSLDGAMVLFDIPALPDGAMPPLALPRLHRIMGTDEAPLGKHFRQVPQAELLPKAPQDHHADAFRRILEMVEQRPCALVKATVAAAATEATLTQCGAIRTFGGRSRRKTDP
jgi:hypothetical protein